MTGPDSGRSIDRLRALSVPQSGRDSDQPPLSGSLQAMIANIVLEFRTRLEEVSTETHYPDSLAYLINNENGILVMIRRRHTTGFVRNQPPPQVGYFAEVYKIDDEGKPQHGLPDPALLNGTYSRFDVTDEYNNPFAAFGLVPTLFSRTQRERFEARFANQPKALPSGVKGSPKGVLEQLFDQRQAEDINAQHRQMGDVSLHQAILNSYFKQEPLQGVGKEMGNAHFVITEDSKSIALAASRVKEVGLPTIRARKIDIGWTDFENPVIESLKDKHGLGPLIITSDIPSFDRSRRKALPRDPMRVVHNKVYRYAEEHPLFAFVQINKDDVEFNQVGRVAYGNYMVFIKDPIVLQELYMKIGIDYLLTLQVRDMVRDLR